MQRKDKDSITNCCIYLIPTDVALSFSKEEQNSRAPPWGSLLHLPFQKHYPGDEADRKEKNVNKRTPCPGKPKTFQVYAQSKLEFIKIGKTIGKSTSTVSRDAKTHIG